MPTLFSIDSIPCPVPCAQPDTLAVVDSLASADTLQIPTIWPAEAASGFSAYGSATFHDAFWTTALAPWLFLPLLVGFILLVLLSVLARGYMRFGLQQFFRAEQMRTSIFNTPDEIELRATWLPFLLLTLPLTALTLQGLAHTYPEALRTLPSWGVPTLLGASALTLFAYALIKRALQAFVDFTFFSRLQHRAWRQTQMVCTLLEAVAVYAVALLAVYAPLPAQVTIILLFSIVVLAKIALFFRVTRIFFSGFIGLAHAILYFCTLEILPLALFVVTLLRVAGKLLAEGWCF